MQDRIFFLLLTILFTFTNTIQSDAVSIDASLSELSRTLPSRLLEKPAMLQYLTQVDKQFEFIKNQQKQTPKKADENLNRNKRAVGGRWRIKQLAKEPESEEALTARTCVRETKAATEEEAYTFAQLAEAAYCGAALKNWTCQGPCQHPTTAGISNVTVGETFGYGLKYFIAVNKPKKWLVVSFRGTVIYPFTMVMNLFAASTKLNSSHPLANKYILVHSGFRTMYNSISKDVLDLVSQYKKDFPNETDTLKITGHSLGGVLAEFLAIDAISRNIYLPGQIQLFTYGAPRVGNKEYVAFLNNLAFNSVTRVTFNNDLVPLLPPQALGFFHHGKELHIRGLFVDAPKTADGSWSFAKTKELQQNLKVRLCNDSCASEDPSCVMAQDSDSTFANHLRAWDIVFGPWC